MGAETSPPWGSFFSLRTYLMNRIQVRHLKVNQNDPGSSHWQSSGPPGTKKCLFTSKLRRHAIDPKIYFIHSHWLKILTNGSWMIVNMEKILLNPTQNLVVLGVPWTPHTPFFFSRQNNSDRRMNFPGPKMWLPPQCLRVLAMISMIMWAQWIMHIVRQDFLMFEKQ